MGKRKLSSVEEFTPTTNHYIPAPQLLKSREVVDVEVFIPAELNKRHRQLKRKPKPNPCTSELIEDKSKGLDKSPEASRMKEFAIYALATSRTVEDYKVVQIGPLAVGELSQTHRILHLNFKAKNLSSADHDEEVCFCELTETIDSGHISVRHCISLGLTHSLPEKADTRGCLYCSSSNIHHPAESYSFQNGGKQYAEALISKLKTMDAYLRKHKTETAFIKMFPDPGLKYVDASHKTTQGDEMDSLATVALRIYNEKQGSKFELLKIGKCGFTSGKYGLVYHLNFKAKNKDDAGAQTFFAQAIDRGCYFLVDFCSCLGPTKSLQDKADADLRGCIICEEKSGVHHPPGPGYLTGREIDYPLERFGTRDGRG